MAVTHPTPEYRAWANGMLARLVPRAAELRADPARGPQVRAAALESIAQDLRARLDGTPPASRAPAPPSPAPIHIQPDLFS